jgi:predicted amidohydrolase YtcJ
MDPAAVLEPYVGRPDHQGVLYHGDISLQGFVSAAHNMGIQVCFHAVGDRAVEQAIAAFEKAQKAYPRPNARHRIEHAQLMTEKQMVRAAELGLVISVQPSFNHVWDHHTYVEYVGDVHRRVDPLKSLLEAGIRVAAGSDSTVTDLRPLLGIHAAVNHSRPEERVSVTEAVRMFTEGVAFSTFDERRRGRIERGLQADLTIVDRDPFTVDPTTIADIQPVMTVVDGRVVHQS